MPIGDQGLVLEDDVCERLLLVLELSEELLYVGLVGFQWLELVTNIVAHFTVLLLLRGVKRAL